MADDTEQLIVLLEAKVDQFEKQMKKAAQVANDNFGNIEARAKASGERIGAGLSQGSQAAAHSIRSMVDQIISGGSPITALGQQLGHLSIAANSPGALSGAFGGLASRFTSFITRATAVAVGIGGIAVAAGLGAAAVTKQALAMDDLATRTNTSVGYLRSLQQAAEFKGVSLDSFNHDLEKIADLTLQAKNNTGELSELFKANGIAAGTLELNVSQIAALIQNASGPNRNSILRQLGLSDSGAAVRFWTQGAAGIASMTAEAVKFGSAADANVIAKGSERRVE
jgi:hypothetical protein